MVRVGALTHTHGSRLIPKVPKSMLKAMGTMLALIKNKEVEGVLEVAAIRHRETITTGMAGQANPTCKIICLTSWSLVILDL